MNNNATLPSDFISSIASIMPSELDIKDFIRFCKSPLRRSIRINTLKISVDEFTQRMQKQDWQFTAIPWCKEGFWLTRPDIQEQNLQLGNTAEHLCGLFYIQEASSMLPPAALMNGSTKLERVLDMAAAPGSKTTQLAAMMGNDGLLVANEYSASRIKVLSANLQRCGIINVALTHFDGNIFGDWLPESFDAILLDAPCSGEGTIRKDPDAMKNWSPQSIQRICETQKNLIESAFIALKTGGSLVYSTCTLNLQENQQVCLHLQQRFGDAVEFISLGKLFDGAKQSLTEQGFLHIWPQTFDSEGFFVAKIHKTQSVPYDYKGKKLSNFPYHPANKKAQTDLQDYLATQFDWPLPEDLLLYQRDNQFWLFPAETPNLINRVRFQRLGVKIAEQHKHGFKVTHEWVMAFGHQFENNTYELDHDQLAEYYHGRDIKWPLANNIGEAIVCFDKQPVGLVKGLKGKLKNSLPRELVRDNRLITLSSSCG